MPISPPPIPDPIRHHFGDLLPEVSWASAPWLPFPWPVQISGWNLAFVHPDAPEIEWVRGILQLHQSSSPTPLARPKALHERDPLLVSFCWILNRLVQAPQLDASLQQLGYEPDHSKVFALDWIDQQIPITSIPDSVKVLLCLELLYRQISVSQQTRLRTLWGEDVMKAAYQLNMMCIDPEDADRTMLQIQRIGLKLCGDAEDRVRQEMQIELSDGRQL